MFYDTTGCEYFERLDGDGDEGSRCNENEVMVVKRCIEQLVSISILMLSYGVPKTWMLSGRRRNPSLADCDHHTVCAVLSSSER